MMGKNRDVYWIIASVLALALLFAVVYWRGAS